VSGAVIGYKVLLLTSFAACMQLAAQVQVCEHARQLACKPKSYMGLGHFFFLSIKYW
jgi:hypothetical protein